MTNLDRLTNSITIFIDLISKGQTIPAEILADVDEYCSLVGPLKEAPE